MGLWDHWVPAANPVLKGMIDEWAAKNKVEVTIDFITSVGNKIDPHAGGGGAGAQRARRPWPSTSDAAHQYADRLTPVNDVVDGLIKQYGPVSKAVEYLGTSNGKWLAVPVVWGSAPLPPVAPHLHAQGVLRRGRDRMVPGQGRQDQRRGRVDLRKAAQDGRAVSTRRASCSRWAAAPAAPTPTRPGARRSARSARISWTPRATSSSIPIRSARCSITSSASSLPAAGDRLLRRCVEQQGVPGGRGCPDLESAQCVGGGQARCADHRRRHVALSNTQGKDGPARAASPLFLGHLAMVAEQVGRKGPAGVRQPARGRQQAQPSGGGLRHSALPVDVGPAGVGRTSSLRKGTIYNYPLRPHHDAEYYIVGSSAPPDIGVQIWSQNMIPGMAARIVAGQTPKQVIDWAKQELEGIRR